MPAGHVLPTSHRNAEDFSPTRFVVFLTIGLALLTGVLVGAIGRVGILAPEPIPASESRTQQLGQAYYDAVDHLVQTGDPHDLSLILSDDFITRNSKGDETGDADDLIGELQLLRNLYPDYRQTITELAGAGSVIVANVSIFTGRGAEFAGLGVELEDPKERQEILQVRDGLIVERWSDEPKRPQLLTVASTGETSITGVPEMRRWHFDLYAEVTIHAPSDIVLIVIGGTLSVEPVSRNSREVRRYRSEASTPGGIHGKSLDGREDIAGGEVLMLPAGTALRVQNGSEESAELVSISGPGSHFNGESAGVTRQLLARGFSLDASSMSHALFIGQVSLDPNGDLAHRGIDDGGEFVFVTHGSLGIEAVDGLIWSFDATAIPVASPANDAISGSGFAIQGASEVRFKATGDATATFWIVTFVPVERMKSNT